MAEERVTRKLAAILATDMVGFSRLMEKDEAGTVARQKAHRRALIDPKIAEHNGRIVKATGDGLLIEFASAVDAVQCAVDVQRAMPNLEADVPDDRHIAYRVGVNIGDIIVEGDDILGDGVNIAARLQMLAEPGGICISRPVFTQIRNKVELGFADLGPQKVKNIEEPVPTYKVLLDPTQAGKVLSAKRTVPTRLRWATGAAAAAVLLLAATGLAWWQPWEVRTEPSSLEKATFPLPMEPSIAVLPFTNLSGDKNQDYLADGLSESIISSLSKASGMLVIARNSTFTYKGKPAKVQQVAEELGVRYVLEGSVQKSGEHIRVTAQLIDAQRGHHLWAETYERKLTELFSVQDEITRNIVVALQVKLTDGEQTRIRQRATDNLRAWVFASNGYSHFQRRTQLDNTKARAQFKRAISLDVDFAWAWAMLGWTHYIDVRQGFSRDLGASLNKAADAANKAMELDENLPDAHSLLAGINWIRGNYKEALAAGRRAIALDPNAAEMHAVLSIFTHSVGDWDETIALSQKAIGLHPYHPSWYLAGLSTAYTFKGEYDLAIAASKKAVRRAESDKLKAWYHYIWAFALIEAGREGQARRHIANGQRLDPRTILQFRRYYRFRNSAHVERFAGALRKAGLPE